MSILEKYLLFLKVDEVLGIVSLLVHWSVFTDIRKTPVGPTKMTVICTI